MMRRQIAGWLRRHYVGITDYTLTMCLFYAYYVWVYVFLGWASGAERQTVDIVLANQFLIPSIIAGLSQLFILPPNRTTIRRYIIWSALNLLVCYVCAVLMGWFTTFPLWAELVFWFAIVDGLLFMIFYFYFKLESETRVLNEQLKRFQQGRRDEDSV